MSRYLIAAYPFNFSASISLLSTIAGPLLSFLAIFYTEFLSGQDCDILEESFQAICSFSFAAPQSKAKC
jgi:hypothetical protein